MDILLGIFLIIFGVAVTFMGTAMFFLVLPMIGFIFGFFMGAAGMEAAFGDGFLSSFAGWIAGLILGLVFAFLAWFWWYAGVLLSAGGLGALLGTGLAEAFGLDSGFLFFLFGLVGFIALASVTYVFNLPVYLIIASTAVAGANLAIIGVLMVFNRVDTNELSYGTASAIIDESWWWTLVALVVAIVGAAYQLSVKDRLRVPHERWVTINSA